MRWEALFADLEAQLEATRELDERAELAELTRAERATVRLADRVRASIGAHVRALLVDGQTVEGRLIDAAPQWALIAERPARQVLVPAGSIAALVGVPPHAAPSAGEVERRLTLGHALRALARDRLAVHIDVQGARMAGRIDRVGADHVELAPAGEGLTARPWAVPFDAIVAVRSL